MSSNLASAMLNSKIRSRAVVGYGAKIFHPSPPNYITRSPGFVAFCCYLHSWSMSVDGYQILTDSLQSFIMFIGINEIVST